MRISKNPLALRRSVLAVMMCLPALGAGTAQAQTQTTNAVGDTAGSSRELEKVVVTARRRAELIQDVPGSVSAISGAELEKQAIPDLAALADSLPSTTLKT